MFSYNINLFSSIISVFIRHSYYSHVRMVLEFRLSFCVVFIVRHQRLLMYYGGLVNYHIHERTKMAPKRMSCSSFLFFFLLIHTSDS